MTCLILGVVTNQPWFFVTMAGLLVPAMAWITLMYRNWPTGIRLDASAINIGATSSARAASQTPTANHQSRGLYRPASRRDLSRDRDQRGRSDQKRNRDHHRSARTGLDIPNDGHSGTEWTANLCG